MLSNDYAFLNACDDLTPIEKMFAGLAFTRALQSKDATKVGSIIYRDGDILSGGYNRFPKGIYKSRFRITEETKNTFTVHAEANAITTAAKEGISLDGSTMIIVGKCPCTECAKLIINSGIKEVICPIPDVNGKWSDNNKLAIKILEVAKIKVRTIDVLSGTEIGLTCPTKYIV